MIVSGISYKVKGNTYFHDTNQIPQDTIIRKKYCILTSILFDEVYRGFAVSVDGGDRMGEVGW